MKRLHVVPEAHEANGVYQAVRMLACEDGGRVVCAQTLNAADLIGCDEAVVHGMWLPREWRACRLALKAGVRLVRMTHGSLSPVYLARQGKWKKRLVEPIERHYFKRSACVWVSGAWEEDWARRWGLKGPFKTQDFRRFFRLDGADKASGAGTSAKRPLHLLYLGRRHPLKGVACLERAVGEVQDVELRIVSDAFGEEKERVWAWCDVLVHPTLSENFGLVVAEALERGKRVITTDGAPAWGDGNTYGGLLTYLQGYRDGDDATRVELLKQAIGRRAKEAFT